MECTKALQKSKAALSMKMNHIFDLKCLGFILLFFGLVGSLGAQKSWSDIKAELRKLDGANYIKAAGDYAEDLALQKKYDESYDLLKRSTKKAKSISSSAYMVVLTHRAEVLACLLYTSPSPRD